MKLTCITPVHIGNGVSFNPSQYIYIKSEEGNGGQIYFLNESKWLDYLNKKNLIDNFANDLCDIINQKKTFSIYQWLIRYRDNLGPIDKVLSNLKQCGAVYPPEPVYLDPSKKKQKESLNNVHPFIRSGNGDCYIPGSSIKGAIRTALLAYDIKQDPAKYKDYWNRAEQISKAIHPLNTRLEEVCNKLSLLEKQKNKQPLNKQEYYSLKDDLDEQKRSIERSISNELKGPNRSDKIKDLTDEIQMKFAYRKVKQEGKKGFDIRNDQFKFLQVSDAIADKPLKMTVVQKKDLCVNAAYNTISLCRECIMPGNVLSFTVSLEEKALERLGASSIEDILKALQYFAVLQYEMQADVYKGEIALEQLRKANLVLGGGTGYLSKTIMYALAVSQSNNDIAEGRRNGVKIVREFMSKAFPKVNHTKDEELSPRTLKLANETALMGLCKVEKVQELC